MADVATMGLDERRLVGTRGAIASREDERVPVAPIALDGLTITDAYEIQRINIDQRRRGGDSVIGHRVGLSSKAMQRMMNVDQPDFGHLLESMQVPDGGVMDTASCIAPHVEVEVAFILGRPLQGPDCDIDDVLAATVAWCPAIEIIDSRIVDWRIGIVDTIADNASSKAFVLGRPVEIRDDIDSRMIPVVLSVNDDIAETGVSAAVLGHPATAVAWLANTLHPFGVTLDAGHVILITCGGQATIPIVHAVSRVVPVLYGEIVSTVSSVSAGPGTRANIDEFTRTTARGMEVIGGACTPTCRATGCAANHSSTRRPR